MTCPVKFRQYADCVENFVPMRYEEIIFNSAGDGSIPVVEHPVVPSNTARILEDDEFVCRSICVGKEKTDIDEVITVPDVPVDDSDIEPDEVISGPTIRTKSIRDLIAEAASIEHQLSHHPHNPMCETCRMAHKR